MPEPRQTTFDRDVDAARLYLHSHQEPEGGWTPEHLMFGAKIPTLGEHGEGNESRAYCERVLRVTARQRDESEGKD